jgi:hypothetical protein
LLALDALAGYYRPAIESFEIVSQHDVTKYVTGAMTAMLQESTKICIEDATRVANQLKDKLNLDSSVVFYLQGSVPLDVHIEHSSDVDLLTLLESDRIADYFHLNDMQYDQSIQRLMNLRLRSEQTLKLAYPAANVDTSGDKAISMNGGSLRRKIDVVPSIWHGNNNQYNHHRAVSILHKSQQKLLVNHPFLHMKIINDKDSSTLGGAKRVIRLLKTLKRDSNRESLITLSSYDIASLIWHMPDILLRQVNTAQDIRVVSSFVQNVLQNSFIRTLRTPDDSRVIFDSDDKVIALKILLSELKQLEADLLNVQSQRF